MILFRQKFTVKEMRNDGIISLNFIVEYHVFFVRLVFLKRSPIKASGGLIYLIFHYRSTILLLLALFVI